jgi:hypothetical protein
MVSPPDPFYHFPSSYANKLPIGDGEQGGAQPVDVVGVGQEGRQSQVQDQDQRTAVEAVQRSRAS